MIQTFEEYKKIMKQYCKKADEALDNNNWQEYREYCKLIDELRENPIYQEFEKKWVDYLLEN